MEDNQKPTLKVNELRRMLEDRKVRQLAMDRLVEGLTTPPVRSYYDPGAKTLVQETDWKTLAGLIELGLAYTDGRPIERKEIVETRVDSITALAERVRKSPELLNTMRKMVQDAEKDAGRVVELSPLKP